MIFLYAFEVLDYDAALTTPVPASSLTPAGARRTIYTHTNFERSVFADSSLLSAPMLPAGASGGVSTFSPLAIKHDGLRLDGENNAGALRITLPASHPVAQLYLYDAPGSEVWLTLAVKKDKQSAAAVRFKGRVSDGNFAVDDSVLVCTLNVQPISEVLSANGLTRKHPRTCPHTLYDASSCAVNRHAVDAGAGYWKYRLDGLVAFIDPTGSTVSIPGLDAKENGWWLRGLVVFGGAYESNEVWTQAFASSNLTAEQLKAAHAPNGGYRRTVAAHAGNTITLDVALPPELSATGLRATVYAGCLHTPEACQSAKFSNYTNYGGFKHIPLKNPYESGIK